jgi:hypothetical protein
MISEYTLTARQQRKYMLIPIAKLSAIIIIVTTVCLIWLGVRSEQLLQVIVATWSWVFLIHFLPLLIIGVRHQRLSKGACFAIDTTNQTFSYKDKDTSFSFHSSEIASVTIVVSPPTYDNRIDILGFGYFFYWKISLIDGRILPMSCMLFDEHAFPGKELIREKRIFPIPPSR